MSVRFVEGPLWSLLGSCPQGVAQGGGVSHTKVKPQNMCAGNAFVSFLQAGKRTQLVHFNLGYLYKTTAQQRFQHKPPRTTSNDLRKLLCARNGFRWPIHTLRELISESVFFLGETLTVGSQMLRIGWCELASNEANSD